MMLKFVSLTVLASFADLAYCQRHIVNAQHPTFGQNSVTQYTSGPDAFDGPKVIPINQTTFDWWYFDAVQEPGAGADGGQPSIAITFHSTGPDGFDPLTGLFPGGSPPSDNLIQINLAWPDGKLDAWVLVGQEATFAVHGDGTSGNFVGSGCSFEGSPDLSEYSVHVDAPEKGIVGTIRIKSDVAPHYPCGPAKEGQDLEVIPGVGWANAIPDGYGEANFMIRGSEHFYFEGRGYHDHNYGSRTFSDSAYSAYWGHGRLGEYSVVWLTVLTPEGEESVSAYVVKGTDVIVSQCEGIHIRPYGENSEYPPLRTSGNPTGYRMNVTTPEGLMELQAERIYVTVNFDFYRRFTGTYTGTLNGEPLPDGVALWEQFSLGE
ncbi:hypothetical protein BDW69DRAFT_155514 [Aspergillus filifer]